VARLSAQGARIAITAFAIDEAFLSAILTQLDRWAQIDGRGGVADAAGGFVLPNGARGEKMREWIAENRTV
jgi:hypothetical protein